MAYIEKETLKEELLSNAVRLNNTKNMSTEDVLFIIDKQPDADVVVHGYWTFARSGRKVVCSCCETPAPFKKNETYHTLWRSPYCPHCGAKMDGRRDT